MNFKFIILFPLVWSLLAQSQSLNTRQAKWQQTVNYTINVELDDVNHIIRGFETIEYINNSPNTLNEIYIHLWPNAYKNNQTAFAKQMLENGETSFYFSKESEKGYIDSLDFFIDGKGSSWSFDLTNPDIVKITLNNPLKPNDKCSISTPFLVKIPKVFSRLGHSDNTYNLTQWYPKPAVYDINGWNAMPYLNQGEFYSEFGSFDVKITLPKNYIVAATGQLMTEAEISFRNDKGMNTGVIENTYVKTPMKTIQFKQDHIHDFAWFASKNFGIIKDQVNIDGKIIETYLYSQKTADLNSKNTDAIKAALTYYSKNSGLYPYSHASVVKSELKAGGGMEYPTITVCDILSQEVIIHEVGHNWFYGILGNNERQYPWMDESINSFFEGEAMAEANANKIQTKKESLANKVSDFSIEMIAINAIRNNSAQAVGLSAGDFTESNYGTMVYGKGAIIFKHLRAYLGDETFQKCFNSYFDIWKFKHPLPNDMQDVFEQVSGKKLDWFFNTLIVTNKTLDPKFIKVSRKHGQDELNLIINSEMPIPVGLMLNDTLQKLYWIENSQLQILDPMVKNKHLKLLIDPKNHIFDANRKNNQYAFHKFIKRWPNPGILLFTRPDNKAKRQMYVLPVFGFNIHNGIMLGAGFHNWSLPSKKLEYMVMPMFGFRTKTLNGFANFNYKITPKNYLQYADVGINNASFAYLPYSETYTYYRTKGYINLLIKPKIARSTRRNLINLEYTNVASRWLEKASSLNDSTILKYPSYSQAIDYAYARIKYIHENKQVINPYNFIFSLERGGYKNEAEYWKPGIEINFQKTFSKKGRGFNIRAFAGTFYSKDKNINGLFMYRLGDKNGAYDYGMEQTLVGRGAGTGLWSNSITSGEDNMKLKGSFGNFSNGFLVINLNSNLPGKIPLKPYADFCFMETGHVSDKNQVTPKMVYSGGISYDIIPKTLMIYFPLVQSQAIIDVQEIQNIKSFGKRICFTFILNDLAPHKLFKRLKLF